MDSLTQLALGAAVGHAVAGRQLGRRALLWGAICGTLPDLDVLVPLGDAVSDFTYHRSASHSLLMQALATPLLAWLAVRLHPQTRPHFARWAVLIYLALATHALLDAFTVYGTQLLWPVLDTPVAWSSIFIIDPLYTLPLLAGIAVAALARRAPQRGRRAVLLGLAASSAYLGWSLAAKTHVEQVARESLAGQGIAASAVLTTPAPFNTLLWRVLAIEGERYHEGFYSLLDEGRRLRFEAHPRHPELIAGLRGHRATDRLEWFSRGFNAATAINGDIIFTDLRMGFAQDYIFRFKIGETSNPHPRATPPERIVAARDFSRLDWLWRRARGEDVALRGPPRDLN